MHNKVITYSIIIIFFLGIAVLPLINSTCGNIGVTEFIPMCRMHTIGQVSNHLDQYKQQSLALVVKFFNNLIFFYAFAIMVVIMEFFKKLNYRINTDLLKYKNISPWDSLKIALAQGLVHNKILPNN